ncbi:uncharacterized protein LTHEOB_12094 [Neofusicoccum parvum]|uniref:Uncharacterized protein LTHEOB_12094 n=1 Tax=Neofusicoccum parvum TaxID=310453 RepID=A0ACB5RUT1_9PEZI|nr:uncharacterized protein LTHEOB_12094 [Neofusicoccum parvum]
MDLPALQFNRLRLSGSPASSPRVVDAPVSPTKSVYLDVDETTPTSPRLRSPYGTKTAAAIRRTNFFDDDSSSDEDVDDEEEEELETADEHPFSQRQSFVEEDEGRGKARSSPRSRSLHTATTNTTTNGLRVEGSTRKGAYYLGVRPEEYAFVCGTRPASSVFRDDCYGGGGGYGGDDGGGEIVGLDASPLRGGGSDGDDGYMGSRRVGEYMGVYEDEVPEPQRETLRREGVSAKHVPFGAPDLAVAARRVLQEQMRRPSSNMLPSASEYEDGDMEPVRSEGGELRKRPIPFGSGNGAGVVSPGGNAGKPRLSDAFEESNDGAVVETHSLQNKTDDNVLAVHAITLQALLRDEEGLQASASSVRRKSVSSDFSRRELFKQQPKDSATSLTPPVPDLPPMVQIQQPKRVSVVPPPIDTNRSSRSKSESKIKTPYPFHHHKNVPKTLGSPGMPPSRPKDAVLTLSIRRRIGVLSPRVARVTLPAELLDGNGPAGAFGDGIAPDETPPPIFDDTAFFKQLRKEYARLAGRWWRFFSARSLRRITVGHTTAWSATESCPGPAACGGGRCCPAARAAHRGVVSHHHHQQQQRSGCSTATPSGIYHVRSPRYLASQGLKETFSEENLLAHFQKPRLGRSRFAWVLWASRLAGLHEQPDVFSWRAQQQQQRQRDVDWRDRELPPTPGSAKGVDATGRTPSTASTALAGWSEEDAKDDGAVAAAELGLAGGIGLGHSIATLEFVEGWSIARILTAVLLVLVLAAAGIVLWILFGNGVLVDGFRGNGATVGTAVLIGAGVLMIGWTLVLAWMGVSWCVV